jgi:hypothetical protein
VSIAAMRLALYALRRVWNTTPDNDPVVDEAITALRQAIEQAEQEVIKREYDQAVELAKVYKHAWRAGRAHQTEQAQPLTNEEIEALWQGTSPYYDHQDFARAIEAAHGIRE